jgi:DNA-binding Lrp family transcriptional regulator
MMLGASIVFYQTTTQIEAGALFMVQKVKLDSVDRQILHDLQDDGRITNVDLAKCAGISAPPCLRRVRVLEDAGIIKGYHADIDADALGYSVQVFAFVGLASQAEADLQDFEKLVSTWPKVRECHMLMGETDFLLKIVAYDWDDFQKFLTGQLTPAKNVSHVKTALAIRSSKQLVGVPIDHLDPHS